METTTNAGEVKKDPAGEKKKITLEIRRLEKIETTTERSMDS